MSSHLQLIPSSFAIQRTAATEQSHLEGFVITALLAICCKGGENSCNSTYSNLQTFRSSDILALGGGRALSNTALPTKMSSK